LQELPEVLRGHGAAALGEIGLNQGGAAEERVVAAQLGIAARLSLPVILHTPRENKRPALERLLALLAQGPLSPERVLLDHLDEQVLDLALASRAWLGLTVHPAKLSASRAAALIQAHPQGRFILSTDLGANPSFLFGIPAVLSAMQDLGVAPGIGRAAARDNLLAFLEPAR